MAASMAFTGFAGAAYTDQADIQATEAVDLLNALNVMTGDTNGSFRPNDTITRAEAARMIYTIRNGGNSDASAYANMQTTFTDVPSNAWYAGYVKHLQSMGVVSGTSDTTYTPDAPVTGVELALMCLRVMGFDPAKADIGGSTWSTKTIGYATEAGILDDVNTSITDACPRQWAAQLMANMIEAPTVEWSNDSGKYSQYFEDGSARPSVAREYMNLWTSIGTLASVNGKNISLTQTNDDILDSDHYISSGVATGYLNFSAVGSDYSELIGEKVKVLFKNGKTNQVVAAYSLDSNTTYTVNASSVSDDGVKVKFDGKSYGIKSAENGNDCIDVYYIDANGAQYGITSTSTSFTNESGTTFNKTNTTNGKHAYSAAAIFNNWENSSAVMKFVDVDSDGRLDQVYITDCVAAEVTASSASKVVVGTSYDTADVVVDGELAIGDWATVSYDRYNDCESIAKVEVITGTLTGIKDTNVKMDNGTAYVQYQIGDTWYNATGNGYADLNTVRGGDDVQAIVVNGTVCMIKRANAGTLGNVPNVAMVVNVETNGVGGKQAKLQFFNDTTAVVDIASDSIIPVPGTVYEYNVSGNKYEFLVDGSNAPVFDTTADFYGDYTFASKAASYTVNSSTINGATIDDTAKVILFKSNGGNLGNESMVVTGKQLKALTSANLGGTITANGATYFTAEINGLKRAAAIALTVDALPGVTSSNTYYAYILDDAKQTATNEISYPVLLEGASEPITVYEMNTNHNLRKANTMIGYKSISDASAEKRYVDDVLLYDVDSTANFGISAIVEKATNNGSVRLAGVGEKKITSDTTVFYIDTDAKTGSTTGTIQTAIKYTNYGMPIVDGIDTYVANALYVIDAAATDELEVLVVESGDRQFRGPYATELFEESMVPAAFGAGNGVDGTVVKSAVIKANGGSSIMGSTTPIANGTPLDLAIDVDNASRKVKVTLTGATFDSGYEANQPNVKYITDDVTTEAITVDGTAAQLGISIEIANVNLVFAADVGTAAEVNLTTSGITTGEYKTEWSATTSYVDIGTEIVVLVENGTTAPGANLETIGIYDADGKLVSNTVDFSGSSVVSGAKRLSFVVTSNMDGDSFDVKATTRALTAPKIDSVTLYDKFGATTTTIADAAKITITFDQAMAADVATGSKWSNGGGGDTIALATTGELSDDNMSVTFDIATAGASTDTLTYATAKSIFGVTIDSSADMITLTDDNISIS